MVAEIKESTLDELKKLGDATMFEGSAIVAVNGLTALNMTLSLNEAYKNLLHEYTFNVGDFAIWKPRLRDFNNNGPFLIIEIFDEPKPVTGFDNVWAYVGATYDAVMLFIDLDGDAQRCPVSLNHLQPYIPNKELP